MVWLGSVCCGAAGLCKARQGWFGLARQGGARLGTVWYGKDMKHKDATANRHIRKRTLDALVLAQEGRCAICHRILGLPKLDHDHTTGAVRGALCNACNLGLGQFLDCPDLLRTAASYIEFYRETNRGC